MHVSLSKPTVDYFSGMPDELVAIVRNSCDLKTWENFRATNHRIKTICERQIENQDLAASIVSKHPHRYQINLCPEVAKAAVSKDPTLYFELPEDLKNNREVKKATYVTAQLLEASHPVKKLFSYLFRLESATQKLAAILLHPASSSKEEQPRTDEELCSFVSSIDWSFKNPLPPGGHVLWTIPAYVMRAVRQSPEALRRAPQFQDDYEIVMEAVSYHFGHALEYASTRLQDNEAVVAAALHQSMRFFLYKRGYSALAFASPRLQDNEAMVLAAVRKIGRALQFASVRLQDSEDVVLEAMRQDESALDFTSERLKKKFGKLLAFLSDRSYSI